MSILGAFAVPHPPIILPEVGRDEEKKIRATIDAYKEAMRRAAALKPETLVITSPHSVMYADYFHVSPGESASGNFGNFRAPQLEIEVTYDTDFVRALESECREQKIPAGTLGERDASLDHGTLIPLRFIGEFATEFSIVRIGLSGLSPLVHYRFGECIARVAERLNRRTVFIASGDLSHKLKADGPYGFAEEGPLFDEECMSCLAAGDFVRLLAMDSALAEGAAECGLRSFWIMAGALDKKKIRAEQLSHEGTFGVGYGVATFAVEGDDASRNLGDVFAEREAKRRAAIKASEDDFVKLARMSVETFVREKRRVAPSADVLRALPQEMTANKAGVFVSLKKDGRLRGCIGTFLPVQENIAAEILKNAVSACSEDPRFSPVAASELDDIVYSVDVLSAPEKIASEAELDPKRYGVIVASGSRRGLLLPDLAGVDTVEEQVSIARQKGGIGRKEPTELYRFEVVRHH